MNMNRLAFPLSLAGIAVAVLALAAERSPAPSSQPATPAQALAPAAPLAASEAELAAVVAHIPGAKPGDVRATPIAGLFEFRQGAELVYVTADGRYGISGDIYRVADKENLSEARRRELRLALVGTMPESSMLVFATGEPKYTVTVFTDVDCGYCRELHRQIADYNRLGIKVRYMFFPRSGPNTESWTKAEQVWCSADQHAALTKAKLGQPIKGAANCPNPVAKQYALGREIGLSGTPGILTENGTLLPGYEPPDVLLQELQQEARPGKG